MRHNSPRVQVGPVRKPSEIRPSVSLSACRLGKYVLHISGLLLRMCASFVVCHPSLS